MRPTARPSGACTFLPSSSSTRASFFSATPSSRNFRDDAIFEPVLPNERLRPPPRHVDVDVDAAPDEVLEADARPPVLSRLESGAQPVGEVAEPVMQAAPRGGLADLHRDDTRRPMRTQLQDDAVDLANLVLVGIDHLLVENVAPPRQRFIHRAPPVEWRRGR